MQEHNCFSSSITRFSVPQPAGKNYFFIRLRRVAALSLTGSLALSLEAALCFEAQRVANYSGVGHPQRNYNQAAVVGRP